MENIYSVIDKIKKAIRLANGTTEKGERETALRLACSLAERSGLAIEEIATESVVDTAVIQSDAPRKERFGVEMGFACSIIREHFAVIVMRTVYSNGQGSYTWFGSKLNIDIARHIHHILVRESRKEWDYARKQYKMLGIRGKKCKDNFMRGFFVAIHQKLLQIPLRNDTEQKELETKAAERKFKQFAAENSGNVKSKNLGKADADYASIISLGRNAGEKVNLARPCEGRGSNRLALANEE